LWLLWLHQRSNTYGTEFRVKIFQRHPTVITERCIGCGMCVTSCGRGVDAFDYDGNQPVVVKPQMCMVGCTTCATICTRDAIEFPSTGYVRQLIRERKIMRQAKDLLQTNFEKYAITTLGDEQ
jgi:NAD-dependent dihydropyrimidine dehydrogenase PreA subunit